MVYMELRIITCFSPRPLFNLNIPNKHLQPEINQATTRERKAAATKSVLRHRRERRRPAPAHVPARTPAPPSATNHRRLEHSLIRRRRLALLALPARHESLKQLRGAVAMLVERRPARERRAPYRRDGARRELGARVRVHGVVRGEPVQAAGAGVCVHVGRGGRGGGRGAVVSEAGRGRGAAMRYERGGARVGEEDRDGGDAEACVGVVHDRRGRGVGDLGVGWEGGVFGAA